MSDPSPLPRRPYRLPRALDAILTGTIIAILPILTGLWALWLAAMMANGNWLAQAILVWLIGAAALPGIILVFYGISRIVGALFR